MRVLPVAVLLAATLFSTYGHGWSSFRGDDRNTGHVPISLEGDLGVLWTYEADGGVTSSICAGGGRTFFGTSNGTVMCIDSSNGTGIWTSKAPSRVIATPCLSDDGLSLIVCSEEGTILSLDVSDGTENWRTGPLGDRVLASPKVGKDRIFVGTYGSDMLCLALSNGTILWEYRGCSNWIHTTCALWEDRIYFGSCDGALYCIDAEVGSLIWTFNASYIPSSPSVFDGKVYFGAYDSNLYCLDAASGVLLFNTTLGGDIYSSPAVSAMALHVGCDDGYLYTLSPLNGSILWRVPVNDGSLQNSPAATSDMVAITSQEGLLLLFRENGSTVYTFRFGDPGDCSPAVHGGSVIWGDSLGYVRAVGTVEKGDTNGERDDRQIPVLPLIVGVSAINMAFLATMAFIVRRRRKDYIRNIDVQGGDGS